MKYYRFLDRFGKLRGGDTFVELEKGFVMRQISIGAKEEVLASNRKHPIHGYYLPTGYIDYAAYNQLHASDIESGRVKPVTTIAKKTFDKVWASHLNAYHDAWEMCRHQYPRGDRVVGRIETFYPQGVVIEVAPGVTGVADYNVCRDILGQTLVPRLGISVKVTGYDELMQWLTLSEPIF